MEMPHLNFLKEIFPSRTEEQIQTIYLIVEQENPLDSPEQKMENMYNMLAGDAFLEGAQNVVQENVQVHAQQKDDDDFSDAEDEGAVGYGHIGGTLNGYFEQLQSIFPDACEDFLWNFCRKRSHNFNFDEAIEELFRDGYDCKVLDPNTIWNRLKGALPLADPSYLKEQAQKLAMETPRKLEEFVNLAIENNDYPTMEEYLKQKQVEDNLNLYRSDHKLEEFLQNFMEVFPDPERHFRDPNRQKPLEQEVSEDDIAYAKSFLYNKYPNIRKRHVDLVFTMKKRCLVQCCDCLDKIKKGLKTKRPVDTLPHCNNLPLLQEVAYLKHRRVIRRLIKYKDDLHRQFKEEARALGILETCGVCAEDELIPEECFNCKKGCVFCKECVAKYVEVRMGDGLTTFPCCNECDSEFTLHILQMTLPEQTFERLALKIQSEEIKRANVDGLEECPFCEFASIPPEDSKIFKCENPDCLKESCRLCRHESHIPKRCNEIEYDEDVRRRTFIENMMTEALARTCYKCNKKFIKTSGCNKMICACGAMMCYLCSQAITGYEHFGNGKPCQLFTNDAQVDLNRVRERAERAKRELGNVEIKFDPSVGIENFFAAS